MGCRVIRCARKFRRQEQRPWRHAGLRCRQQVYLAIQTGTRAERPRYQFFEFGVGVTAQAAICTAPAKLEVYPPDCSADGDALPGCKASKGASGLSIVDGDCDSIHLYWDHDAKLMRWWLR